MLLASLAHAEPLSRRIHLVNVDLDIVPRIYLSCGIGVFGREYAEAGQE
jgi:hypothetical protein